MKKKVFGLLTVVCLVLTAACLALSAGAATSISTAEEMLALMNDNTMWAGDYKLTADVDLSTYNYDTEGALTQKPIGNAAVAFTGSFDGGGHTLSGLDIAGTDIGTGLFGVVSDNGDTTVIKNLTIKGSVTSTANFIGGLVGIICGDTEITSVTSELTAFTPISRAGGLVGGIVNNGYAGISAVANSAAYDVTIKNCVNKTAFSASLTSEARAGGIVGSISTATTGRGANNVYIADCVNYGDITGYSVVAGIVANWDTGTVDGCTNKITNCKNYGQIEATAGTAANNNSGGIIGFSGLQLTTVDGSAIEVTYCYNEGTVKANNRSGGIVGYGNNGSATEMLIIDSCFNAGKIETAGSYNAGIIGVARATVTNCYNTGAISGDTFLGGIAGYLVGTFDIFNYNYTSGSVSGAGATSVGNAFGGYATNSSSTANANYYSGTDLGDIIATYVSDVTVADNFTDLNTDSKWTFTTTGPELAYYHEHTDADGDEVCDTCQEDISCKHASSGVDIAYDAENACITYSYDCCGAVIYKDRTVGADVYVSTNGVAVTTDTAIESDIGLSEETAFADFETAMKYAAASVAKNGEVTVHIVDSATVPGGYKTPKYDGMITITGGSLAFNTASRRFYAFGGVTFENLTFKSNSTDGVMVFAQNNKMVFGEGVVMDRTNTVDTATGYPAVSGVKMYVYGGYQGKSGDINADITIRSGDFWFVGGWNSASISCTNSGESKITIGKTNADDYLFTNYLVAYSTGPQLLTKASKTTIIIDGEVDMHIFNYGTLNNVTDAAYTGVLFETDLVLKGDINELSDDDINAVDIDSNATTTNTKLNVYVDRRSETAKADSYLFLGGDPDEKVAVDATIAARGTVVNSYSYVAYCNIYLGHTLTDEVCISCGAMYADANGDGEVTVADVMACIKAMLSDEYLETADTTADGKLTLADALRILKKAVK